MSLFLMVVLFSISRVTLVMEKLIFFIRKEGQEINLLKEMLLYHLNLQDLQLCSFYLMY